MNEWMNEWMNEFFQRNQEPMITQGHRIGILISCWHAAQLNVAVSVTLCITVRLLFVDRMSCSMRNCACAGVWSRSIPASVGRPPAGEPTWFSISNLISYDLRLCRDYVTLRDARRRNPREYLTLMNKLTFPSLLWRKFLPNFPPTAWALFPRDKDSVLLSFKIGEYKSFRVLFRCAIAPL